MSLNSKQKKDFDNAAYVQKRYESELLGKANVNSVGIGYIRTKGKLTDKVGLVVTVETKQPMTALSVDDQIPKEIDGVRIDVHEVGKLEYHPVHNKTVSLDANGQSYTGKIRPLQPGYSIGNVAITAGTAGYFAYRDGVLGITSNAHVGCADPSKDMTNQGEWRWVQPGTYDGGNASTDVVADLKTFVLIQPNAQNWTDASWAALRNGIDWDPTFPVIGTCQGLDQSIGVLGEKVKKVGRTTGYTEGTITQVNVTAQVSYGSFMATFYELCGTGAAMSAGGDSGSNIFTPENKIKYRLFAGSSATTLMFHIMKEVNALRLTPVFTKDVTPPSTDIEIDFTIDPVSQPPATTYRVFGVVRSTAGNAVPQATVTLNTLSTTTDASGNYQFTGVAAGAYTMTATKTGYTTQTKNTTIGQEVNEVKKKSFLDKIRGG